MSRTEIDLSGGNLFRCTIILDITLIILLLSITLTCVIRLKYIVRVIGNCTTQYPRAKYKIFFTGPMDQGLPPFAPPPFSTTFQNRTYDFLELTTAMGTTLFTIPIVSTIEHIAIAKAFGNYNFVIITSPLLFYWSYGEKASVKLEQKKTFLYVYWTNICCLSPENICVYYWYLLLLTILFT